MSTWWVASGLIPLILAEDGSGRSGLFWWKGVLLLQPEMVELLAGCADPMLALGVSSVLLSLRSLCHLV